ncbi:helix-turn-helix domain-containing protein [Legionella pneumophila]|uniref:helix-turn-helix domain-containing protein n=1 Tax=Legionella pneumophila TaxID=446 RepID=UPI003C8E9822
MSTIKEKIGQRIYEARKAKGLSQQGLANLTTDLKQSRINNWENGLRTPGPEEIKQLANALEVSAAFLMCLSDEKQENQTKKLSQLIPLFDHHQACNAENYLKELREQGGLDGASLISASTELLPHLGADTFALKMSNDSMMPEFRPNDILVIDPSAAPEPGNYVAVKVSGKLEAIVCQYKKLSYTSSEFELLTLNDHWPNIKVINGVDVEIIGKVIQCMRGF